MRENLVEIKLKPLRITSTVSATNTQTSKTNTICFLSAHPKYDAYAVKGHTLTYSDGRTSGTSSASPGKPSSFFGIFNSSKNKNIASIKKFIGF